MLVTLKQKEIEAALTLYVQSQGINLTNKRLEIQFTAGRKEAGISAEVDISDIGAEVDTTPVKPLRAADEPKAPVPNDLGMAKEEPSATPAAADNDVSAQPSPAAPRSATSLFS